MAVATVEPTSAVPQGGRLGALVDHLPLRLGCALFAAYVAFMGVGATLFEAGRLGSGQFDLDAEGRVFAVLSGAILVAGALLVVLAVIERVVPAHALALGVLLAFMGADEVATIHEHLERATGVDWVLLYLPLMAFGGIAALDLLRRTRVPAAVATFLAGGGCWAIAVVLEKLEWPTADKTPVAHYVAYMIPEELLEITGSFLFALALVLLLRHHHASRAASRQVAASS